MPDPGRAPETYCPSPPVVRVIETPVMWRRSPATSSSGKAAELERVDRILHDDGVLLLLERFAEALAQAADDDRFELHVGRWGARSTGRARARWIFRKSRPAAARPGIQRAEARYKRAAGS